MRKIVDNNENGRNHNLSLFRFVDDCLSITKEFKFSIFKSKRFTTFLKYLSSIELIFLLFLRIYEMYQEYHNYNQRNDEWVGKTIDRLYYSKRGYNFSNRQEVEHSTFISPTLLINYIFEHGEDVFVFTIKNGKIVYIDIAEVVQNMDISPSYITNDVVVNFKYENEMMSVIMRRGEQWWISGDENKFDTHDFISNFRKVIIQRFKGSIINIRVGEYDPWVRLSIEDEDIKYYDENVLKAIEKVSTNALENNEKVGVLLYGVHGVSKTSTINHLSKSLNYFTFKIKTTRYDMVKEFLNSIPGGKMIILEDVDTINNVIKNDNIVKLLDLLDSHLYNVVILTCNDLNIDPAILRSGRCDKKVLCPKPDDAKRDVIIRNMFTQYNIEKTDEVVERIVQMTNSFTHAEINAFIRLAKLNDEHPLDYYETFKMGNAIKETTTGD